MVYAVLMPLALLTLVASWRRNALELPLFSITVYGTATTHLFAMLALFFAPLLPIAGIAQEVRPE